MTIAATTTAGAPGTERNPLTQDLAWMLSQAAHVLHTELHAAFDELGFAPRGYCVLVAARTGEFTQKELADMIGLDKTTMVVTVDELERTGLAARRPSPGDRRARIIAVTDEGERAVAEGQRVARAIQDDVLSTLPAEQRDAFLDGLTALTCGRLSTPAACERSPRRRD